jgi:sugar phosphate isomerase/epimerase
MIRRERGHLITLTGFADEISSDLEEQLDTLASEGIAHLEFRGVWGKNVLKLTDEEAAQVKARFQERGFRVSSIGSPIGKIKITDDFAPHLADFERAIEMAKFFEAPYIRIFSFFIPEGEEAQAYKDEVLHRMNALTKRAEEAGVYLLHENEKHIYGENGQGCRDILESCNSAHLRAAFDPANYVQSKVIPMQDAYPLVESYIEYIHIKDALLATGKVVPAGEGDGQLRELIAALKTRQYSGFMSLEPHLKAVDEYENYSKPELFKVASQALKKLLAEAELEWN